VTSPPAGPAGPPAVEVSGLTIRYGDHVAIDGLSFVARQGEITALLGPNGAGKTSTVETLEGYRRATAGTVRVLGLDPWTQHAQLVGRIGVMLQTGGVYTGIRPPEVLRLFASYYDDPADPDELLDRVGLADRRRSTWRSMSGGEQQRLSLALALVGRPRVAFLDEPTAGIDPAGRQLIRRIVAGLRDEGVAVLLTTHDLDEAEKLADRVVIIDHGHLLADATPSELMAGGQGDELHFGAPGGLDTAALGARLGAAVTEDSPGEYRVAAAPTPATVAALTAWLAEHDQPLADLRAGRQSLEDVFLRLTRTAAETDAALATERAEDGGGRRARGSRRSRRGAGR
jgi:ABC-2 type transport system ATP-binding protein